MERRLKAILVAVDFGSKGDDALIAGLGELAAGADRVLHLLHVLDPRTLLDDPEARLLEREEAYLSETPRSLLQRARTVALLHNLPVAEAQLRAHARLGAPAATILQACVDYDADLLICGTHGRKGVDRLLEGSVAERLLREARCPLLVARPKDYSGCTRTELPDPAYQVGEAPRATPIRDEAARVTSTTLDSWHPSDNGPTGFRIV